MLKPRKYHTFELLICFAVSISIVFTLFQSCNKEDDLNKLTGAKFNPTYAVPLINGGFTIDDILKNLGADDFITADSNNLLTIIYRANLFEVSAGTLFEIPSTTSSTELQLLDNITITDINFATEISLGSILPGADSLNGQKAPFPEIGPQSGSTIPVNSSNDFTSITFSSGLLTCTVINDFPSEIIALKLDVKNQSGSDIGSFNYSNIPSGGQQTSNIDLAGKTMENNINVVVANMHLAPVGDQLDTNTWIVIDTTDKITMNVSTSNLQMSSGNVVIPDQVVQGTEKLDMTLADSSILLYDVKISSGGINYSISSDIKEDMSLFLEMPYITKTGQKLTASIPLDYSGVSPVIASGIIDMKDYSIDFTGGGNDTNTVAVKYTATITSSGNAVPISTSDKFIMDFTMADIKFSLATGYFSKTTFDLGSDTVDLNLYDNYSFGSIELEDPRILINITNSYGFPMEYNFKTMYARKINTTGPDDSLSLVGFPNPDLLKYPKSVGDTAVHIINLGSTGSNIIDAIALPANQIIYTLEATSNPNGFDPNVFNFFLDTSSLDVTVDVELKLFGKIGVFTVENMYDFNIGDSSDNYDEIKSAEFSATFENGFPLDIDMQIYFADSLGPDSIIRIDSMITDKGAKLIMSAEVDANGDVTTKTTSSATVAITGDRLDKITQLKNPKMIIKASFNSTKEGTIPVKLYTYYGINIMVGVKTELVVGFGSGG